MSVQQKLEHDQDKIKMLIHDIENLGHSPSDLRKPLFIKLKQEIKTLYKAEEDVVHEAVNDEDIPDQVSTKKKETISVLKNLDQQDINSQAWQEEFSRLKDTVFNQVEHAQETITPIIDDIVNEPDELAEAIVEHKQDQLDVDVLEMPKKS